jgi:hypothetical protein
MMMMTMMMEKRSGQHNNDTVIMQVPGSACSRSRAGKRAKTKKLS